MKISNLTECTTAGAVATVAQPFETVQKRTPEKKLKGSNLLKGIKTSAKYANSLHEGEVVQFPGAHTHDNIDCPNCGEPMQGGKMPDGTRVKVCVKCLKYRAEPNQNLPAAAGTPNLSVVKEDNSQRKPYVEGAKVDRMVGHVKSSEKKLGKSSKEAENIAWATANKRGMLDNKNKKVAEGTIGKAVKSVKRGMQGWGSIPIREPQEIVTRNKGYDDEQIKMLHQTRRRGEHTAPKHSPQDLQNRVVDREMKKRGLGEQGVAEGSDQIDVNSIAKGFVNQLHADPYEKDESWVYSRIEEYLSQEGIPQQHWQEIADLIFRKLQGFAESTQGVAEADDKKEWQKQNAKPKQLGKTEKYFSTRHTTKDTGAADKEQGVAEAEEQGIDNKYRRAAKKMINVYNTNPKIKAEVDASTDPLEAMVYTTGVIKNPDRLTGTTHMNKLMTELESIYYYGREQGVAEGRFVKGPGGVPLDRQGNSIPPKPQAEPKAPAVRRDANGLTRADYNTVWRKIEDVVGQIFPDGDPIDWLGPWLDRQGIKDYHGGEVLNKACRLNGYKDIYAYYDHFKTGDYGYEDPKLKGFLDNGGQVQHGSFKGPRKAEKTDFGSTHIGGGGDKMKASRTGLAARSLGNKIVGLPEEKEKTAGESDISTITDPELRHAIEKAKTHYGGIKDPITAFRKLTIRGLKHAEDADHRQDEKIKDFEQVINRMKQEIFSLRQQVSRPVSEGEITEDDVVLSADRRKPKSGLLSKPEPTTNPADTVKLDVPLLIRLLEFSKEDAVDDMALHDLAEKLVAGCQRGRTLTMKDYDNLVPAKQPEYNATDSVEPEVDESLLGGSAAAGIIANDDSNNFEDQYSREMDEGQSSHKFRILAFLKSNEPGDVGQRKEFTITARTDREAKILAKQRLAARGMEVRELHIIGSEEIA